MPFCHKTILFVLEIALFVITLSKSVLDWIQFVINLFPFVIHSSNFVLKWDLFVLIWSESVIIWRIFVLNWSLFVITLLFYVIPWFSFVLVCLRLCHRFFEVWGWIFVWRLGNAQIPWGFGGFLLKFGWIALVWGLRSEVLVFKHLFCGIIALRFGSHLWFWTYL